ncbi:unnamed protein product [Phytophthora fragariaefolia]|uniref:Unnamed protein product n=1 Tax=Phytophthora fragariaefolia TaxID=1490495 RepID=A0A9W6XCK7_9STRA|nr:unnamed protein product [Phytophthora fragariaefolia]
MCSKRSGVEFGRFKPQPRRAEGRAFMAESAGTDINVERHVHFTEEAPSRYEEDAETEQSHQALRAETSESQSNPTVTISPGTELDYSTAVTEEDIFGVAERLAWKPKCPTVWKRSSPARRVQACVYSGMAEFDDLDSELQFENHLEFALAYGERYGWWSTHALGGKKLDMAMVHGAIFSHRTRIHLDTGATTSIISLDLGRRLKHTLKRGHRLRIMGFGDVPTYATAQAKIKLMLGIRVVYVMDVWVDNIGAGLDCLLGMDFMVAAGVRICREKVPPAVDRPTYTWSKKLLLAKRSSGREGIEPGKAEPRASAYLINTLPPGELTRATNRASQEETARDEQSTPLADSIATSELSESPSPLRSRADTDMLGDENGNDTASNESEPEVVSRGIVGGGITVQDAREELTFSKLSRSTLRLSRCPD